MVFAQLLLFALAISLPWLEAQEYRGSPKLTGPAQLLQQPEDDVLQSLDVAMDKISNVYMQALLSGRHTPEVDISFRALEMELYELLERLYKLHRLKDYMKYEAEVTRQMYIYAMLKELFGYTQHVAERRK